MSFLSTFEIRRRLNNIHKNFCLTFMRTVEDRLSRMSGT
jgi:hypothetical protein